MNSSANRLSREPFFLASQSPRRRTLLQEAGYSFQVIPPREEVESQFPSFRPIESWIVALAQRKAADVAAQVDRGWVLACDTVAVCDDEVLGKPIDRADAQRMLRQLSGRQHQVLTGMCLWHRPSDQCACLVDRSTLVMAAISDRELMDYLDSDQWQGKAGAFGYQDGWDWLQLVQGSAANVVGLPVERLPELVSRFEV
jgi:septum formation protein